MVLFDFGGDIDVFPPRTNIIHKVPHDRFLYNAIAQISGFVSVSESLLPPCVPYGTGYTTTENPHLYRTDPRLLNTHKWAEETIGPFGCEWAAFYYQSAIGGSNGYRFVYVRYQFLNISHLSLFKLRWL